MALESCTADRPPDRRVSTQDDFALSDKDLAKWLARKAGLRPLVRSVPALHGFATAAIIGPPFADPQLWICPAMGFRWDVVARGSNKDYQVLATVSHIHNAIADALDAGIFAPAFTTKSGGSGVDPAPWCQGFYSAMQLQIDAWSPFLDLDDIRHGLLLPILAYCVDEQGAYVLGPRNPGPTTEHFFEHEGHKDIALVVPAIRDLYREQRSAALAKR